MLVPALCGMCLIVLLFAVLVAAGGVYYTGLLFGLGFSCGGGLCCLVSLFVFGVWC